MDGDVEVNDAPAVVGENHGAEEQPEGGGGDDEEIAGCREALPVPPKYRFWFDQDEDRAPLVPDARQDDPESPLGMTQPGSYLATEDGELLTKGEIFQSQLLAVPEEGTNEQEDDSKDGHRGLPGRRLSTA